MFHTIPHSRLSAGVAMAMVRGVHLILSRHDPQSVLHAMTGAGAANPG